MKTRRTGTRDRETVQRTQRSKKKKRRVVNPEKRFEGETDRFGAILKHSEDAQRELEKWRLGVEK